MSPYHSLRMFESLTGLTPHQYVIRIRLRNAALRLAADAGVRGRLEFGVLRLPPLRKLSLLVARACSRLA
ncbi:MAG: hypothetical protein ACRD9L_20865, partial [Bryobacteraceae bacterium]